MWDPNFKLMLYILTLLRSVLLGNSLKFHAGFLQNIESQCVLSFYIHVAPHSHFNVFLMFSQLTVKEFARRNSNFRHFCFSLCQASEQKLRQLYMHVALFLGKIRFRTSNLICHQKCLQLTVLIMSQERRRELFNASDSHWNRRVREATLHSPCTPSVSMCSAYIAFTSEQLEASFNIQQWVLL
jgi:hypothetical protein